MSLILADRVRETTTTTGTGAVTLGGAYTGFQTFLAAVGNTNTTYYTISNVVSGEWEVGIGTYSSGANTLSRTTVLSSSSGGSLVNFTSGSKDVFVTQPAERNVYVSGTSVVAENSATVPNALLANSAVTINGNSVSLGGSTTITAAAPNALTIGTGLSGTSYNGSAAVTVAIDSTVATLTGSQTLTNKTLTSPVMTTPALGTPASGVMTNVTGLPIATGVSGLGTGVATALAVNIGSAGAPVLFNGALGTPSSGTVTNLTGTASININGTVGATTAAAGAFTTLSATGQVTSTVATGTAPLVIASTTKVANLNVDQLDGADWAAPPAIGSGTPAAGSFTTLAATGNVTLGDAAADTVTVNGTTNFVVAPTVGGVGQNGFKNRIINGAMVIDQRNAGASVTGAAGSAYILDRFGVFNSQASKFTFQQNAGSVTPPVGFKNYLGATSLSAYTVGASESFSIRQFIEGYNVADLAFGTANASTVTLSFWVRSSLTGSFGGALNNGSDRFYPFSYTISSANTWEQKTVTVAGDTSGTWATTNGNGLAVQFSLGAGASVSGTAGAWTGSTALQPTGSVSVVGTNGATFYITGVQLEKGSAATSFDYRPFSAELSLCQRYFQLLGQGFTGCAEGTSNITINEKFQVTMRSAPSSSVVSGQSCSIRYLTGDVTNSSPTLTAPSANINGLWTLVGGFTGLTTNTPIQARNSITNNLFIALNSEL